MRPDGSESRQRVGNAKGLFPGWYVVAGAFAVTLVGFGCAYTFTAFVDALEHDFRASRGSVSLVFSLAGLLYFALGIVSGPLADRWARAGSPPLASFLIGALGWRHAYIALGVTAIVVGVDYANFCQF
jgi:predicted MFS family arabinose efflux permease